MRWVAVAVAALAAQAALAAGWEAGPADGRLMVNVYKKGLFSAFAHDHHFVVTQWRASADVPDGAPASTSVLVVLSAGSLRDRQEALSEGDRKKVEAQAAKALDAEHHPKVTFRSDRLDVSPGGGADRVKGTLHGTLSARGRDVPVDLALEADRDGSGWRVHGKGKLKQTALGIEPFSGFG